MARAALFASACMIALGTLAVPVAEAQDQVPPETVTEIDPIDIPPERDPLRYAFRRPGERGGFYLRLFTNLGYHNTRLGPAPWQGEVENVRAQGFGTSFGADIGGYVKPWLALHLDAVTGILWNGDVERDFAIASVDEPNARILTYGLAPAATFVMPHDFFFKAGFGVGLATIKRGGRTDTTDPGFFMDLVIGKDVYKDEHVVVGLQMQILYMNLGNDTEANEARVQQYLWGLSVGFDSM